MFQHRIIITDAENVEYEAILDALVDKLVRQIVKPDVPRERQSPYMILLEQSMSRLVTCCIYTVGASVL